MVTDQLTLPPPFVLSYHLFKRCYGLVSRLQRFILPLQNPCMNALLEMPFLSLGVLLVFLACAEHCVELAERQECIPGNLLQMRKSSV